MARDRLRQHRVRPHAVGRISACVLGFALLLDVAQAGQSFLYCLTMQQVMAKSCCTHAGESEPATRAILAARTSDCCELRVADALAPFSPSARAELPPVTYVALPVAPLLLMAARDFSPTSPDPSMRAGPPPGQARAQLMVFLI